MNMLCKSVAWFLFDGSGLRVRTLAYPAKGFTKIELTFADFQPKSKLISVQTIFQILRPLIDAYFMSNFSLIIRNALRL